MSLEYGNQVSIEQQGSKIKVLIDGNEILGVKSVSFESDYAYVPSVTISFCPKITTINKEEEQ